MSATRLPGKPLLKINGLSIISHVSKKAEEANIGDVIVATEDQEIIENVKGNGFNAILTSNKHKTGTDRIYEVFKKLEEAGIDPVLFGITDKDFQVLARNFAQIRQKLQETNNLLQEYQKYYEGAE